MKYKLIVDKQAEEEVIAIVHAPSSLTQQIEDLIRSQTGTDGMFAHSEDGLRRLAFADIECITVLKRKVIAVISDGTHCTLRDRLRDLEELLPTYFIRINKSTLANEHRIARFEAVFSGGVDAVFASGHRDYVSRRCFAEIRRRFESK